MYRWPALSLTTATRNAGVGLVIVLGSFARSVAVPAVVVYGLFSICGSLLVALAARRIAPSLQRRMAKW